MHTPYVILIYVLYTGTWEIILLPKSRNFILCFAVYDRIYRFNSNIDTTRLGRYA